MIGPRRSRALPPLSAAPSHGSMCWASVAQCLGYRGAPAGSRCGDLVFFSGRGRRSSLLVVPTLSDLIRGCTSLAGGDLEWLHSLVSDWQLLADLSFADLCSGRRCANGERLGRGGPDAPDHWPDRVPRRHRRHDRGSRRAATARHRPSGEGRICREGDPDWTDGVPVRGEPVPVTAGRADHRGGRAEHQPQFGAHPSRLELTYLQSADELAQMVAAGRFPFPR